MEPDTPLEEVLVTAYKDEMVIYLQGHPADFPEAIDLAVGDRPRYSWRAAWLLGNCIASNDGRIKGAIDRLVAAMPGKPDGHWRELMKIVSVMQLDDEQEGRLFEMAIAQWQDTDRQPSVRWMAFRFLIEMVKKYPELASEVRPLMRPSLITPLSPGIRRSLSREVKKVFSLAELE